MIFSLFYTSAVLGLSDFAVEVVDFQELVGPPLYNDPQAVLGKPATRCLNNTVLPGAPPDHDFRVKIVEAAYYLSIDGQKVITELYPETEFGPQSWIVVRFDHKVLDYPGNPYGQDLIVFGNSLFSYKGTDVGDSSDLNTLYLFDSEDAVKGYFEKVWISVSQNGQTWYSYDPNRMDPNEIRFADGLYPTQAYRWDRAGACWTDQEMDFTLPVDPNLKLDDFAGLTAADAIDLYRGSGGGTPFDLQDLPDFQALEIDPETGCRWIQYVRLEGGGGPGAVGGEVDAVSDVASCGDPTHPYPMGDLNQDCRVDLRDFLLLSVQWLDENYAGTNPADLVRLCENWLACTYQCG